MTPTQSFETLECRLFRDGVQFCSGLVDLVVCVCHHGGGGHRLTLAGERFVDLVGEDTGVVAGDHVLVLRHQVDVIEQVGAGASGGYPVAVEPERNPLREPHWPRVGTEKSDASTITRSLPSRAGS